MAMMAHYISGGIESPIQFICQVRKHCRGAGLNSKILILIPAYSNDGRDHSPSLERGHDPDHGLGLVQQLRGPAEYGTGVNVLLFPKHSKGRDRVQHLEGLRFKFAHQFDFTASSLFRSIWATSSH